MLPRPFPPPLDPARHGPAVQGVIAFFDGLQRADLHRLQSLYREDAEFRDPFNQLQGLTAIRHVFEDMFERLHDPRFEISHVIESSQPAGQAFMTWSFHYGFRAAGPRYSAPGGTLFVFDDDGLIALHHDYWDAAGGLYAHLPVVGPLMRWLRRRVAA